MVDDDLDMLMNFGNANLEFQIHENISNERRHMEQEDPLIELSDRLFIGTYRLCKRSTEELICTLTPYMIAQKTTAGLSIKRKILTALRFFASGSYQQDIGEHRGAAVSQPSVSRCITEVASALNHPYVFNKYVQFPTTIEDLNKVRSRFYEKFGIPGVIGVIDCTQVAIVPPNTDEHIYVNRKGYHSINTQLVCDSDLKILNVCAKFPGSAHDSHIWRLSSVQDVLEHIHSIGLTSYFLLGDSGYGLRPWIQTPLYNPEPNTPAERYNKWLCRTRSIIERCNGVLKMRFRCLLKHRGLHYQPEKAATIINACTILHNICIVNKVPIINNNEVEEEDLDVLPELVPINDGGNRINPELTAGRHFQQHLIETYLT